jgi:hypothetical protein
MTSSLEVLQFRLSRPEPAELDEQVVEEQLAIPLDVGQSSVVE